MAVVEIEVDTDTNANLFFQPLQEHVRGRFLPARVRVESAGKLAMALPDGVPGQRIRLDTDKAEATVLDPLAAPEHARTRDTLAKIVTGDESAKADRLAFAPPARITPGVHVPTWVGWMVRAVKAGYARVVSGQRPDAVPGECQPRVYSSMSQGPRKDDKDGTIEKLTALLVAKLSPAERKELAGLLGK